MPHLPWFYGAALVAAALTLGFPLAAGLGQTLIGGLSAGLGPGLGAAWNGPQIGLSLSVAIIATVLSLLAALGLAACFPARQRLLTWVCLPLLAIPHAAVAQALTLLLAPSGFIMRLLSPWATGFHSVPSLWLWDQHPDGWTLILALMIKEIPFFLILIFTFISTMPCKAWIRAGVSLGYSPIAAWWHSVFPALLPRLMLPICLVLAFCLSVVDVAALVGPSRLKIFAHALHQAWTSDTPRALILAGALWLLILTFCALAAAWLLIRLSLYGFSAGHTWRRLWAGWGLPYLGSGLGLGVLSLAWISLALLPLQSIIETSGRRTRFPDIWTGDVGLAAWDKALAVALPTLPGTLALGFMATTLALGLALWLLEGENRQGRPEARLDLILMTPLFLPQFGFLGGAAFLGLKAGLIPLYGFMAAVWFHLLFVFPYAYLVMAPAFRGLDGAYLRAAASLGLGPTSRFWRVKIPLLLRPLSYAFAWGMAVSFALYLPTYFASGGRFETLLSLGISQLSGRGDSVRAVWGLLLLILPLIFFIGAAALSALQARNRRGLSA